MCQEAFCSRGLEKGQWVKSEADEDMNLRGAASDRTGKVRQAFSWLVSASGREGGSPVWLAMVGW